MFKIFERYEVLNISMVLESVNSDEVVHEWMITLQNKKDKKCSCFYWLKTRKEWVRICGEDISEKTLDYYYLKYNVKMHYDRYIKNTGEII
jgi:hypothetical protein